MTKLILAVVVVLTLIVGTAAATPFCISGPTGVNVLELPDPCQFGGLTFFGWNVFGAGLTSVTVFFGTGSNVSGSTVNVSFQLSYAPIPPPAGADILLSYAVSGLLLGVDLVLGTFDGPVAIIENVCAVPFQQGGCPDDNLLATLSVHPAKRRDEKFFAPHQTIYIRKDIVFGSEGGLITDFTNSHHVPEPVTLSLTGLGLLAAGWLGRRRVRR
jgi:hypothetical protein